MLISAIMSAQPSVKMTGLVLDINGEPVIGAGVVIKDTSEGMATGLDGKYSIEAEDGDIIVFSSLGYQDVEVQFAPGQRNIVLRQASQILDDVVVIGYGSQKKESVTGSLTSVSPDRIKSMASVSISNTIGGIMPGIITRQTTGEPGSDFASVYIRGLGTWGNSAPLILVDGVERDMNNISASDIESYTVLKDASATAVYGVKGANGAIIITTKRGKMGPPKVTFRTEFANLHGLRFPQYISGYEFASLMNEAVRHASGPNAALPWTEEQLRIFKDGSSPYLYPSVNWIDEILKKNAFQTINNLGVSGGNEIIRYYVNIGYTNQEGLFKRDPQYEYNTNSNAQRVNYRSNVDINITKNLILALGINGIIEDKRSPGTPSNTIFEQIRQTTPIQMPKQNPDGTPGSSTTVVYTNPWALSTQSGYATETTSTIQTNFNLKWDLSDLITEGLSINANYSFDYIHQGNATRYINYEKKRYLGKDEFGQDMYNIIQQAYPMVLTVTDNVTRSSYYDIGIHYNRTFGEHTVSGMLLGNRREKTISYPGITSMANLPYRRQGLVGRFTYDYGGKYLAEFNFGFNGSENFPKGDQYGFFPAVSVGWVASKEKFWQSVMPGVYFKIRASYGLVGNDEVGGDRFLFLSMINTNASGTLFGESQTLIPGYSEYKTGADVTWEKSAKFNGGFELRFFRDRLTVQTDFFIEDRYDILLERSVVPVTSGITTPIYANLGRVDNRGIDAQIDFKNTTRGGLFYSVYANYTYAYNKIIENDKPEPKFAYQDERGRRIGQPFVLVSMGFFESQEEIDHSPKQTFSSVVRVGDIRYVDVNKDGVIDDYDRVPVGYARTPEMMFGFGGTLAYKGFDLSLHFTGAAHATTFLNGADMWPFSLEFPQYNVSREYYDHRWVEGADNSNARYPAVINGNNTNNYQLSTQYMRDASYLKLKNAEIGYTIPEKISKKAKMSKLRIFINGSNLFSIDKLKIVDPEFDYGTGNYPIQRVLNIGLDIEF